MSGPLQTGARTSQAELTGGPQTLLRRLLATPDDPVALAMRFTIGLVMIPHGLQKTLGLFGGAGFSGTMGFFTETLHIPWIFALAAILTESLGALALLAGVFGRLAALVTAVNMFVAAVLGGHFSNGFFMNWFGNHKGEGFEYHILAIAIALVVVVRGSGRASVDRWLARS